MSTKYIASNWRLPNQENSSKSDNYGLDFDGSNEFINIGITAEYSPNGLCLFPKTLKYLSPIEFRLYNLKKFSAYNSLTNFVVAYTDIFYVILVMMNNVGQLIPLFLLLLVTYQAGSLTISAVMNWYNSRVTSVKI